MVKRQATTTTDRYRWIFNLLSCGHASVFQFVAQAARPQHQRADLRVVTEDLRAFSQLVQQNSQTHHMT
jgi:hypothetical protein